MDDVDESYFDWSDDEEDIICSSKYISSDEEDDDLAAITALKRHKKTQGGSVFGGKRKQEDAFEREMASELSLTMQQLTSSLGVQGTSGASQQPAASKKAPEFYDDVYFDSDESDNEEGPPGHASKGKEQRSHHRHKVLTNDELFYDPTMDDRDQEWVNQKRRSYQPRGRRPGRTLGVENNNTIQLPPSDAVLNCPACLTTLCMDCQRHEIYHNQYRAMFVFNCVVDVTERLHYASKDQKKQNFIKNKKAWKNKKEKESEQGGTEGATGSTAGSSKETQSTNQAANRTESSPPATNQATNPNESSPPATNQATNPNESFPPATNQATNPTESSPPATNPTESSPSATNQPTNPTESSPPATNPNESSPPATNPNESSPPGTNQPTNPPGSLPPGYVSTTGCVEALGRDVYHPVMCKICNTKVAVYDSDEVYHFFNIVTSY